MENCVILPLRGEVLTTRWLTNGVQRFLLVAERYRNRQIFGIYSWSDERIFMAEFLMGMTRRPDGIGAIHGVIREVGRPLRRGSTFLVVEQGGGGTWYILYDREDDDWAIDEVLVDMVIAHDAPEVSDEEE
jgi:hypothetical protein